MHLHLVLPLKQGAMLFQVPVERGLFPNERNENGSEGMHDRGPPEISLEAEPSCHPAGRMWQACRWSLDEQSGQTHCTPDKSALVSEHAFSDDLWLLMVHQVSPLSGIGCSVFFLKYGFSFCWGYICFTV